MKLFFKILLFVLLLIAVIVIWEVIYQIINVILNFKIGIIKHNRAIDTNILNTIDVNTKIQLRQLFKKKFNKENFPNATKKERMLASVDTHEADFDVLNKIKKLRAKKREEKLSLFANKNNNNSLVDSGYISDVEDENKEYEDLIEDFFNRGDTMETIEEEKQSEAPHFTFQDDDSNDELEETTENGNKKKLTPEELSAKREKMERERRMIYVKFFPTDNKTSLKPVYSSPDIFTDEEYASTPVSEKSIIPISNTKKKISEK